MSLLKTYAHLLEKAVDSSQKLRINSYGDVLHYLIFGEPPASLEGIPPDHFKAVKQTSPAAASCCMTVDDYNADFRHNSA